MVWHGVLGVFTLTALAWGLSEDRRRAPWKTVAAGLGLQFARALHTRLIMIYALCGFANFGSLGIMIGGLGTTMPERRGDIVALGLKSIVSGTIATCLTGAVTGIVA